MWGLIKSQIDLTEFLGLWVLSTFVLLIIWMISVIFTINAVRKGKPGPTITIEFISRKFHELVNLVEIKKFMDIENDDNRINEENLKIYLSKIANYFYVNLDYLAKNTETRMRPIALFFLFLLFIGLINFEHYFGVTLPQIQQTTPILSLALFWFILLYAIFFFVLGFYWNIIFFLSKILRKLFGYGIEQITNNYKNLMRTWTSWINFLTGLIILFVYSLSTVLVIGFLLIFPLYVDYQLMSYYWSMDISHILVKFFLVFLLVYLFFKLFEILFSIHLVERIKNDKITWLKHIKFDIISYIDSEHDIINDAKERIKLADLYSPVPCTSLAAFTRYEIIPVYRYDVTSESIQKRLEFLNKH